MRLSDGKGPTQGYTEGSASVCWNLWSNRRKWALIEHLLYAHDTNELRESLPTALWGRDCPPCASDEQTGAPRGRVVRLNPTTGEGQAWDVI